MSERYRRMQALRDIAYSSIAFQSAIPASAEKNAAGQVITNSYH